MDMRDEWLRGLRSWASRNDAISELWLFGSRATGRLRPDSDVDVAVVLIPSVGSHDWAGGNYVACHSEWKRQLEAIVGRHVSLEAVEPGTKEDAAVRKSGKLLWVRD
jgi:predicted nucleotidyltransferase